MKIAIGSDHAGYQLKEIIIELLQSENYDIQDFGTFSEESVDYPDIGRKLAEAVAAGEFDRGILICGAGIGMSIVANKVKGIRAALCSECYSAKVSIEHNNANILVLGGRTIGTGLAGEIVRVWMSAKFDPNSRHARRVAKIES